MGTRSVIARSTGSGFKGVYHHWDGYPSGLGATLFELFNGHFKHDSGAMLKYLIDDHPAGWSTINSADFSQPPGFEEAGFKTDGPHCYCHGGRHEEGNELTHETASGCGCEWAYVFDGDTMEVYSSYRQNGDKMIGFFGCGDDKANWWKIASVDLRGEEPDWKAIEEMEPAGT